MKILKHASYLQMIRNSRGTKMFRNLYLKANGKKIDATRDGELSCAVFVSSVLLLWGMIEEAHATVKKTVEDMQKNGWKKISVNKIHSGDVIVWEEKVFDGGEKHFHIGFYIGDKKAISNSHRKRFPTRHYFDYHGKRKIIAVYTWPKFLKKSY